MRAALRIGAGSSVQRAFLVAMAAYGLALWGLSQSPLTAALAPLESRTAEVTAALLDQLGLAVHRQGTVLSHPAGFSYEIYYPCTGLTVIGFLLAGLLALPGSKRSKLAGVALELALNQLRLLHLFYVGVHRPAAFDLFHDVVWEAAMLLLIVGFWQACSEMPARRRRSQPKSQESVSTLSSHATSRSRRPYPVDVTISRAFSK